jgi:hypothetical protein
MSKLKSASTWNSAALKRMEDISYLVLQIQLPQNLD